jgi:hypothetical protein
VPGARFTTKASPLSPSGIHWPVGKSTGVAASAKAENTFQVAQLVAENRGLPAMRLEVVPKTKYYDPCVAGAGRLIAAFDLQMVESPGIANWQ